MDRASVDHHERLAEELKASIENSYEFIKEVIIQESYSKKEALVALETLYKNTL